MSILNISSINANRSLKKNLHLYINLLINKNIDILLIQEPGPFLNSSASKSTNQVPYHLTQAQYNCIAQTHHNDNYSLLLFCKFSIFPLLTLQPITDPHIQHLTFISPIKNIHIINTYIPHNKETRNNTIYNLSQIITATQDNIILGGDLNSFPNAKLDYYSNPQKNTKSKNQKDNLKYYKKEKEKTFALITNNILFDCFRHTYPTKKDFSKWTIYSTSSPPHITATRLDHFLTTKPLLKRINNITILKDDISTSDHLPIFLSIFLYLPKSNHQNKNLYLKSITSLN